MKDRLAQFLKSEQLTAVKFAEIMEVQPSSISHLLSGRNKPNFEFISRMLLRFPELNPEWIINGIGSVYKRKVTESPEVVTDVNGSVVTTVNNDKRGGDLDYGSLDLFEADQADSIQDAEIPIIAEGEIEVTNVITDVTTTPELAEDIHRSESPKSIARVILFYTDGSFEEYHN